ncbi:hypothetical protein AKJ09_00939 [Labilithrix luteola]|uniref:PEGA domain-containing protein n=1 Tax=Labilithrix luteola TaxID=1391654 RepID=A0A0K1PL79_9BACT|nr:PEGA domain-containing protein [Labilithrix luteola]AKU94275.1 hypothetical protein AKJ09_00939 [Labilithrix luteola]
MKTRLLSALLAASLLGGIVRPAFADDAAPSAPASSAPLSAEAKMHFARGVKLYSEEDYRGALVEFKRAHELSGIPLVLYNIGQTQFQLRDYAGALQSFERYLAASGGQISEARKQQVDKDMEDLRGRVGKVSIETSVPNAEISVDDVSIGRAPLTSVVLSSGVRKIVATHPEHPPVTKTIEIAGGDDVHVRLEFSPSARVRLDVPASDASQDGRSLGPHPLVFVGYGAAVAGLAVGGIFGALALGTKSDLDESCHGRVCPKADQSRGDTLTTQATISTVGFGVAAAGALVGSYFLFVAPAKSTRHPESASRPSVTPYLAGTGAGLVGRF